MHNLPKQEGIKFIGPPVDITSRLEKYELNLGNTESLLKLTDTYTFFTPAILYLYANFTDAPLIDFIYEIRQNVKFYYKKFNTSLFSGLVTRSNNKDWNHVLWCLENQYWEYFYNFLLSVTMMQYESKSITCIASQEINILDPVLCDKKSLVNNSQEIKVTVFCINSNKFQAAFDLSNSIPKFKYFPPASDILVFANAFFADKNPVNARMDHKKEKP